MQKLKIEKRIGEELAAIRKYAAFLPQGKANALLNKCNNIAVHARKAQAVMDNPVGVIPFADMPVKAPYDARTQEDMAAQAECKKAVLEAMMAGRKVSLKDSAEFKTSQMHTTISKIRHELEDGKLPFILCDSWHRPEGGRPYKIYWLIPKED